MSATILFAIRIEDLQQQMCAIGPSPAVPFWTVDWPVHRYTHLGVGVALTVSEVRVTQLFARFER
jgi:hypothetical protein